jgi:two-component system, OmpR family, sensor histidine kinase ArlS
MNFKARLTFLFCGLFMFVLSLILAYIYIFYANFRREEFFERLKEKCETTARLLAEGNEVDKGSLKIIDQNSINKMYDEKILVFNEKNELIYSSLNDEPIIYSLELIDEIRKTKEKFYVDDDGDEVVGIHYNRQGKNYVVLGSAYDTYGINKLQNLFNILIGALLIGTVLIAVSSYFYILQVFRPIDALNRSIQNINENNLKEFIKVKKVKDELDKLAINYNEMLRRLFTAFESQRSFVRNAAHELKTPQAKVLTRLERLIELVGTERHDLHELLDGIMDDLNAQASLVESLLLLQRLQSNVPIHKTAIRIDEILYESIQENNLRFPGVRVKVDLSQSVKNDFQLIVKGNAMLLKICFRNLVENVAFYGSDQLLSVTISADSNTLQADFVNAGETTLPLENVFEPFYRGTDGPEKPGHGLGLSIVKQIVTTMNGSVQYFFENGFHCFRITFHHA